MSTFYPGQGPEEEAMEEKLEFTIYPQRVEGPNKERGIAPGDWRDADIVLKLDGAQVYPADTNERGASEPDWTAGWELRWGDKNFVEVPPDRPINPTTRMYFRGDCRPPEIIVKAWKNGLILTGCIIARDHQRHGV